MKTGKKLGIWMDHSTAYLTEFSPGTMETKTITSQFTQQQKELSLEKGENHMHMKEKHKQSEYYRKLGEAIKNYEDVILFGPTDAKVELFNIIKEDHLFSKIKIEIKQTDKITESHQQTYVKEYFTARQ